MIKKVFTGLIFISLYIALFMFAIDVIIKLNTTSYFVIAYYIGIAYSFYILWVLINDEI